MTFRKNGNYNFHTLFIRIFKIQKQPLKAFFEGEFHSKTHVPEPLFYKVHCLKSVQIWNFFWSVSSQILSEYVEIRAIKNSVFRHFPYSGCRSQPGTFLKKSLRFTLSFVKFLRIPFLRNTTVPLLLKILRNF